MPPGNACFEGFLLGTNIFSILSQPYTLKDGHNLQALTILAGLQNHFPLLISSLPFLGWGLT